MVVTNPDRQSATLVNAFGVTISESADVVGTSISSLLHALAVPVSEGYQFCVWGLVETMNSSLFWLDDGSGVQIKVFAPEYASKGITNGAYASVVGTVDVSATVPVMVSRQDKVQEY